VATRPFRQCRLIELVTSHDGTGQRTGLFRSGTNVIQRDEATGLQQTEIRMTPAQQGLDPDDASVAEISSRGDLTEVERRILKLLLPVNGSLESEFAGARPRTIAT
jgi:hypothetical protein